MKRPTEHLVEDGWGVASSFVGSIIAGLLIGLGLDYWLGTGPWLTIGLSLLGVYSGYMRLYRFAEREGAREERERIERRGY